MNIHHSCLIPWIMFCPLRYFLFLNKIRLFWYHVRCKSNIGSTIKAKLHALYKDWSGRVTYEDWFVSPLVSLLIENSRTWGLVYFLIYLFLFGFFHKLLKQSSCVYGCVYCECWFLRLKVESFVHLVCFWD